MTGSGEAGNGVPAGIRTDIAHPARVYDYWLSGKDNFPADRAAAEQVQQKGTGPMVNIHLVRDTQFPPERISGALTAPSAAES